MHPELRHGSVAAIVLDSAVRAKAPPRPRRGMAEGSLAAIVLGTQASRRVPLGLALLALAVALYVGGSLAAFSSHVTRSARVEHTESSPVLVVEHIVELEPPEPSPRPQAQPTPVVKERAVARAPSPPSDAPPPARAGQILAADESASAPLDFTDFMVSAGSSESYAGGRTAGLGTSSRASHALAGARRAELGAPAQASRARPVGPPRREWDCSWPAEAEALTSDEQFVVIRALVRADGSVASVELISEPGYGFGAIALACARQQRFPPATDDAGRPITATSPPIRVRFSRR